MGNRMNYNKEMEIPSNVIPFPFVLILVLATFSPPRASSGPVNNNDFLDCITLTFQTLNSTTSDVIYTPQSPSFSSLLRTENLRPASAATRRPVAVITPLHESQIQAAIHCSKKHGLQTRVRGGGHDYEGLSYTSYTNPFFVVDMRNLRTISIDTEANTAWIQVGTTLGQLYHTLAGKNMTLAFSAGVCPTVGVGGLLTGGGYGMMSRRHGLSIDRIIDAKVMNADGEVLDRKSMGEDLFWAIRGGGGCSFGIVLSFKVNLVLVSETVTVFNVTRTLEQNATQLVHRWQFVADKIDDNLLIRLNIRSVRSPVLGKRTIRVSFTCLFLGGVHDLLPIMQEKFPELGLVEQDCSEMSWIESVLFFAGFRNNSIDVLLSRDIQGRVHIKAKSDYARQPISEDGLKGLWELLKEEDEYKAEVQFSPYGGRLNDFSESETPFPHRSGTIFMIQYMVTWSESEKSESERHISWIRKLYSYMAPHVSNSPRAAYFNYRDLDIGRNNPAGNTSYAEASVWGSKYFKNNFKRLVLVKTKFDPTNFFRNEQSIPPLTT